MAEGTKAGTGYPSSKVQAGGDPQDVGRYQGCTGILKRKQVTRRQVRAALNFWQESCKGMNGMADEIDRANDYAQMATDAAINQNRKDLQPGTPGDCDLCGEWSGRLINGACAPCRDKFRLP